MSDRGLASPGDRPPSSTSRLATFRGACTACLIVFAVFAFGVAILIATNPLVSSDGADCGSLVAPRVGASVGCQAASAGAGIGVVIALVGAGAMLVGVVILRRLAARWWARAGGGDAGGVGSGPADER